MYKCRRNLDRRLFKLPVFNTVPYSSSYSGADSYSRADSYSQSRTCTSTSSNRCTTTYHSPSTHSDGHNWIWLLQFAKCWKGVYMYSTVLHECDMQYCRWYLDRWLLIMSVSSPRSHLCSCYST
jgi:hypothetical protein